MCGFWSRGGVFIGDMVVGAVLFVLTFVMASIITILYGLILGKPYDFEVTYLEGFSTIISMISYLSYFMLNEWLSGTTPVKRMFGMRVVRADGQGCSFAAALLRTILRPIDELFCGLIAAISMQGPLRQRLGDRAANTLVVNADISEIMPVSGWMLLLSTLLWMACNTCMLTLIFIISMPQRLPLTWVV